MKVVASWPVYRFELPYLYHGRFLGRCLLEIYGTGVNPKNPSTPVVVITQRTHDPGSITNNMELICTLIHRDFLVPLDIGDGDITWVQHYERAWRNGVSSPLPRPRELNAISTTLSGKKPSLSCSIALGCCQTPIG